MPVKNFYCFMSLAHTSFFAGLVFFLMSNIALAQTLQNKQSNSTGISTGFRVVLDPGHGGKDSVTRSNGFYEKDIVLNIAKEIKDHLSKNGFDVIMTRESDEFIPLSERAVVRGDVFISLHANSVADTIGPSVRSMIKGMEIYTGKNMQSDNTLIARSKTLAAVFQEQLAGLEGISSRGIKEKQLAVLNQNQSAAILIELGYLTNEEDLAFLTNKENYKQIAEAFSRALKAYQSK
jgi:N-acetylmuramoyl-L-alanine amidase